MKLTKTKLAAASFGAAMTSLYSAPELNAQLVDLSFTLAQLDLRIPMRKVIFQPHKLISLLLVSVT